MKIAFATNLTEISGVDAVHFTLSRGLHRQQVETHFLSLGDSAEFDLASKTQSQVTHFPTPNRLNRIMHPSGRLWNQFCMHSFRKRIQNYLIKHNINWWVAGHLGYLWYEGEDKPFKQLGIIHAPDEGNLQTTQKYHRFWDLCIAVSQETADAAISRIPELEGKVIVVPNGIELRKTAPEKPKGTLQILWCGRIENQQKRVQDLITCAKNLIAEHVDFKLHIVGDGVEREALEAELQDARTLGFVVFHGRQHQETVRKLMQKMHAFLLVSNYEGTPMALLEAMSEGCIPVSSTGCGGLLPFMKSEFPDNLFQIGDTNEATRILKSLSESNIVEEGKQTVQHLLTTLSNSCHNADNMVQSYLEAMR